MTPAERLAPRTDRGSSDFDVRHLLSGAVTYELPELPLASALLRNWSVAALYRAQTATPINVTYSRDIGFGFFPLRPDLVPGVPVFINDPNAPGGNRLNTDVSTILGQSYLQTGAFLTAGVNGGLNPVFQVGAPRSAQLVLKLTF